MTKTMLQGSGKTGEHIPGNTGGMKESLKEMIYKKSTNYTSKSRMENGLGGESFRKT